MIVCHCHAVRDRDIRQCIRAGNSSLEAIGQCTGAGTGCGGCHETIAEVVEAETCPYASEMPSVAAATPGARHLPIVMSEVA